MIYLVSLEQRLFQSDLYKVITAEESLKMMENWSVIQFDSETTGRNAHINKILCIQMGNDAADAQIVVDTNTIDIQLYKDLLESHLLIGQNLKFDLQFLYSVGIIPRKVYDTMIVEQVLYLGYPAGKILYSLKEIAKRRLHVDIDKTVRGEIIWRGLDDSVIQYSAGDVLYLEKIRNLQLEDCKNKDCLKAIELENNFVPVISYMEWCGIKLDENKWKAKMAKDKNNLDSRKQLLDNFCINHPTLSKFSHRDLQGDLFSGFNTDLICNVNWSSSRQVVEIAKLLGFNTVVLDKKTGEDKDSVLEKSLKSQKGICDEFLELYFNYQESAKVVSTYGQSQLNMINPITGRCHTVYKQLGAASGRMSCGSRQSDTDLAKLKGIPASECHYCNFQQLPADDDTRGAFVAEEGNYFCSCDYSAMESYLAADIYNDKDFQYEFTEGSKDTHSLFAWMVFRDECKALGCTCVADVKKKAPQWRKKVKAVEFAWLFGAAAPTISQAANCTVEEAEQYIKRLEEGFKGISAFAKAGSRFVRNYGYVLMNKYTGHKMYWWDFNIWKSRQKKFTQEFWEEYRNHHKGTGDAIAFEVREHFQAAAKWDRMARNAPTQGTGANIIKLAMTNFFNWIMENNLFNIVKIVAMVHDEACIEYPKNLPNTSKILESIMKDASGEFCKFSKIPAAGEVSDHWVH